MQKALFAGLFIICILFANQALQAQNTREGVPLQGEYVGKKETSIERHPAIEKMGSPSPLPAYKDLPVIDPDLEEKAKSMGPWEMMRVILFLNYQPHDLLSEQVQSRHAAALREIKSEIRAIHTRYGKMRNQWSPYDAQNYRDPALILSNSDQDSLRIALQRHEDLSLVIRNEFVSLLSAEVKVHQQSVKDTIESLGGTVESELICVNALIALLPASSLQALAQNKKVARIVGNRQLSFHLDIADNAILVSAPGGLWSSGERGGLFDPAVIDTGADLQHPALQNKGSQRVNFYSWYLAAGASHGLWNDDDTTENDFHGHGSHVTGIVASYGTPIHPGHRGMSYGVAKAVTLKAGWLGTDGNPAMLASDTMHIADKGLYHSEQLHPLGTFLDEVDGLNMSAGYSTILDDDDYSRFFDSLVSSFPDLVLTLSGGNAGPANAHYGSPACCYNSITVANIFHGFTPQRSDDSIFITSSHGPTEFGRRKPDIAAPGTFIKSCNNDWESEDDFVDMTGTSMAAPMVQGVAMDLMDAGILDELEIKALLINTAQKNEDMIKFDFPSNPPDHDGWSQRYGWGYLNADRAYYHRSDVITSSVTGRSTPGHFRLFKGWMHDEGAPPAHGRDRVTMVWNRHVTYNPHEYPVTYYAISDLDLKLYNAFSNALIDEDVAWDNVHQVRVGPGADFTKVVVKAYAVHDNFAHGGETETFALATEESFEEVELPGDFQGHGLWPLLMEPNEQKTFLFWIDNNSVIACHNNLFDLELPAGWTLLSGADTQIGGTILGGGSSHLPYAWGLKAPPTEGLAAVKILHTHDSYGEEYGPVAFSMWVNVQWDLTPPSPNPMTFAEAPKIAGPEKLAMTAATAFDSNGPVEYYFELHEGPKDGSGGKDSGWQEGKEYTEEGLLPNHQYGYRVKARDSAAGQNETAYSDVEYSYTLANILGAPVVNNPTQTSLDLTIIPNGNPLWTEISIWVNEIDGEHFYLDADGLNNGNTPYWNTLEEWGILVTASELTPGTEYMFGTIARNGDGFVNFIAPIGYGTTLPIAYPQPDIKANGIEHRIVVSPGESVSITVSLDPGDYVDETADWWILVETQAGFYSYVYPAGWRPGIHRAIRNPLFNLPPFEVYNDPLPQGDHVFHFAVDENADDVPDLTWRDVVMVRVGD